MEVDNVNVEEEVEKERKPYESDTVWTARKAFLTAHWGEYTRDQLDCYSMLFINVNMIGCLYSPILMNKIKEMGAGIMEKANKLNNERKFVYASRGRAEAEVVRKKEEEARERDRKAKAHDPGLMDRIRSLRAHMLQAVQTATPEDLIKMCERVQLRYYLDVCADGTAVLRIKNCTVFKHRFIKLKNPRSEVISTVTNAFIHCDPSVSENCDLITFNDVPLEDLYRSSLQRRLNMAARQLSKDDNYSALGRVFASIGLELTQTGSQLEGWSQQVELRAGEILVATKVLGKNESVKAKREAAIDELCKPICEAIRKGSLKVEESSKGFVFVM